jgi:hypothetical protein
MKFFSGARFMEYFQRLSRLITFLCLFLISFSASAREVVALLTLAKNSVEYSIDGEHWKRVTRNKLLFDGSHVRVGSESSVKLTLHSTGEVFPLVSGTRVQVFMDKVEVVDGSMGAAETAHERLFSSLQNRFTESQRYATVRRGLEHLSPKNFSTVDRINASADFPWLVWESPGGAYTYELFLNGESIEKIDAVNDPYVRYKLDLEPGEHNYEVRLYKNDKLLEGIPVMQRSGVVVWSSPEEAAKLREQVEGMKLASDDNAFYLGWMLGDRGYLVASLDYLEKYFEANPEEFELKLQLIRIYEELKLFRMKNREAKLYTRAQAQKSQAGN